MAEDAKRLGVGSLLWVDGLAYCLKGEDGWRFLEVEEVGPAFTDGEVSRWVDVEVVRAVEYGGLKKYPVGSVISFDSMGVAVRVSENLWKIAGVHNEYTNEQLGKHIIDKSSIKELV